MITIYQNLYNLHENKQKVTELQYLDESDILLESKY